jgi:hypothetical protein
MDALEFQLEHLLSSGQLAGCRCKSAEEARALLGPEPYRVDVVARVRMVPRSLDVPPLGTLWLYLFKAEDGSDCWYGDTGELRQWFEDQKKHSAVLLRAAKKLRPILLKRQGAGFGADIMDVYAALKIVAEEYAKVGL